MFYLGKDEVLDYTNRVTKFIDTVEIKNEYGNLICDYIEELYLNGYPVFDVDMEKSVYLFYNYLFVYNHILKEYGESEFISFIVEKEISKNLY